MANAKICDNCKKVIEDINIQIKGYKVETKEKLGYEIGHVEDFCSFNCLAEYAKSQQELLNESIKIVDEYKSNNNSN